MPNERSPRRSISHPKLTRSAVASSRRARKTRDVGMRSAILHQHINGGGPIRRCARCGLLRSCCSVRVTASDG
jgi:hypothetical protein